MTLPLVSADPPAAAPVAVAVRSRTRRRFRDRTTYPLLILLTVIAGLLRFASLDRPSIWGDEAATYGRVAGTYQQLLDQLTDSSFPPLHYEVEWWIGQGMPYWGTFGPATGPDGPRQFTPTRFLISSKHIDLTPFALRFVPALAGTLFVPAIFFLAVQLFGRRVALTAAALACFSAYALVFSRDAKMYMHFWLFVTLHVACTLWWVRTRRLLPWACWVFCGLVMVGLHAGGFVVLLIDALIVFTSPRQYWFHAVTAGRWGIWTSVVGPSRLYEVLQRRRGKATTTGWQYFAVWQRRAWRQFRMPTVVPFAIGLLIFATAAQGPLGFYSSFSRKISGVAERDPAQVDLGELGIGWVSLYNEGRTLPGYLLYTTSAYLTGWEWPRHLPDTELDDAAHVQPRTLLLLQTGTVGLLGLLSIGLIPWRRLFQRGRARLDRICQDGRVSPANRSRRVWWIAIWVTAIPWVTYTQSTAVPLNVLDGVAKICLVTPPTVQWPRVPVVIDSSLSLWQRAKQGWAVFARQWPDAWHTYSAAWTQANVSRAAMVALAMTFMGLVALIAIKRRAIGRGALRLGGVLLLLLVLSAVIVLLPRKIDSDVWLPRYLGVILPAVFVFVAVLIDRQPVPIRGLTLGLFVIVNMGQFSARVWGDSEPPAALIAADVAASQPKAIRPSQPDRVTFRAYTDLNRFRSPEPGGGAIFTAAGRYYLRLLSGVPGELYGVRGVRGGGRYENALQILPFSDAGEIERDLRNHPQVERFAVWTALAVGEVDLNEEIGDRLYGKFKRVSDEVWQVRDHWRWYDRYQLRRRVYERVAPPADARPH